MSVVRIDSADTHGWQARVYVAKSQPRLTSFCSDGRHGGSRKALAAAWFEEARLKRRAARMRKAFNVGVELETTAWIK